MKIMSFAPYVPYEIARHHDVTLVVPGYEANSRDIAKAPSWLQLVVAPYEEPGRVRRLVDLLSNVAGFPRLDGATRRGLLEGRFLERTAEADIVELQWQESTVLISDVRRAGVLTPIAVVTHDVLSNAIASWVLRPEMSRVRRLKYTLFRRFQLWGERSDFDAAELVIVFKEQDQELLRQRGVKTPIHVTQPTLELPNGPLPERSEPSLLFTGAMGAHPNRRCSWGLKPPVSSRLLEM